MLYVGHFSFAAERRRSGSAQPESWHGYFTCVAEADTIPEALNKLKKLIRRLRNRHNMFTDVERIYLDSCIQSHSIPRGGFLAYYSLREGADTGDISTSIRGATPKQAIAFSLGAAVDDTDDEPREIRPFIVF